MLQHQPGGVRAGPSVAHVVAVMQQCPRVVQRVTSRASSRQPAVRCWRAAGAAAPQMQGPSSSRRVQLLLGQRHAPVIALDVKRNRPGGFANPGFGKPHCDRVHARSPRVAASGPAAVSIATRSACRWAIERFSLLDSSRPDRWM